MASERQSEKSAAQSGVAGSTGRGRHRIGAAVVLAAIGAVVAAVAVRNGDEGVSAQAASVPTCTVTRGDLMVTVTEQGTVESAENVEIKCRVRGDNTIIWVIENGSFVEPGDELVRLDTLAIEDAIAETTKFAHLTRSGAERAKADMAAAELAISEYLEGRYRTELMTLEKDLTIAKSNHRTAQNMLAHAEMMSERGYVSELELEDKQFAVTRAQLNMNVQQTRIDVLKEYTKAMELETLNGALEAAKANYHAESERAQMDAERRELAESELEHCVIRAERSGLVIYPRGEHWRRAPQIEEGATVHQDQTLLLMPDMSQMQVRVGIHESVVDRIAPGMAAEVKLGGKVLAGEIESVAPVTRPSGWWTGNVVKYDTIVKLASGQGLKPGMSAEVEVVIGWHEDVLTAPVTAVVETGEDAFCWVEAGDGFEQRRVQVGATSNDFIVIEAGLEEGVVVALDPLASIEQAQELGLKALDEATAWKPLIKEGGDDD